MYIRRSEDVLDVFWTFYVRSIYVLCLRGRVNKKRIKSPRKEYAIKMRFKFLSMKNISQKLLANESLIMACLQIYRELLLLATFLRVHSNSKEVSYFSWQNRYPNSKTACHVKLNFSCELNSVLESLLLAKYLISVAATLIVVNKKQKQSPRGVL